MLQPALLALDPPGVLLRFLSSARQLTVHPHRLERSRHLASEALQALDLFWDERVRPIRHECDRAKKLILEAVDKAGLDASAIPPEMKV